MLRGKGKRSKTDTRLYEDLNPDGVYIERHRCFKRMKTCISVGCKNKFVSNCKQHYCEECQEKLKLKKRK